MAQHLTSLDHRHCRRADKGWLMPALPSYRAFHLGFRFTAVRSEARDASQLLKSQTRILRMSAFRDLVRELRAQFVSSGPNPTGSVTDYGRQHPFEGADHKINIGLNNMAVGSLHRKKSPEHLVWQISSDVISRASYFEPLKFPFLYDFD